MKTPRVTQNRLQSYRQQLALAPPALIEKLLSMEQLLKAVHACNIEFRDRLFTPITTVWVWARQRLSGNGSCKEAVAHAIAWLMATQQRVVSSDSSGYCQARTRQTVDFIKQVFHQSAGSLGAVKAGAPLDRPVFIADATSCHVSDTPSNRKAFRAPSGQTPGCGLPVVKILGLFSLVTGAAVQLAMGWTNASELGLFYSLWSTLPQGALVLADSNFGNFMTIAGLVHRGVDCLMRVDRARKVDFRQCTKRLGPTDGLFTWPHPKRFPWMDAESMHALPQTLLVRVFEHQVLRPGFRPFTITLVTTLLDPVEYPTRTLAAVYARRWDIELDFRHIKTTLGMERINARSPQMVEKDIYMYMVVYNMIRQVMFDASQRTGLPLSRVSLKGSLDLVRTVGDVLGFGAPMGLIEVYDSLLASIAQRPARHRPNRHEPRVIKHRGRKYPYMTQPRDHCKQICDERQA